MQTRGLEDGLSGFGNSVAIHRFGTAQEQRFHNGKALNQVLHAGDAYILRSGGGGGFGSPLERDLDSLARDVRCGYVSKDAAEKNYGAVFEPATNRIDPAATSSRRAEMRGRGCRKTSRSPIMGCRRPRPHAHVHDHAHDSSGGGAGRAGNDWRCCS
jgi:N-methylhydantoinase B